MDKKYEIHIEKPHWDGYKYALFYSKKYGNNSSGTTECKTKQELLDFIKEQIERWEGFDSILGRISDKVTKGNVDFVSFTDEISIAEIFGIKTLFSFGLENVNDNNISKQII